MHDGNVVYDTTYFPSQKGGILGIDQLESDDKYKSKLELSCEKLSAA